MFGKDLDRYTVISRERDFRELFDRLWVLGSSRHKYLSNGQELHISLCKKINVLSVSMDGCFPPRMSDERMIKLSS